MRVCGIAVRNRAENRSRRRLHSKDVKTFEPASHRLGHFADEGGSSPPMGRRQTHQRSEVRDNRIAVVFEVKFEPLGRKYCCASRRSAILSCKRQRGALKQKNSADPSFDVTAIQKPSLLRPMKNAGIASLTIPASRGRNCAVTVGGSSTGRVAERSASRSIAAVERVGIRPIGSGLVRCTVIIGCLSTTMTCQELPRTNVPGLRCSPSHPVTDKGIEHFAKSDENSLELFANVLFLMSGIVSDCGHRGLSTNLTAMMCRRCHRNARWLGV